MILLQDWRRPWSISGIKNRATTCRWNMRAVIVAIRENDGGYFHIHNRLEIGGPGLFVRVFVICPFLAEWEC